MKLTDLDPRWLLKDGKRVGLVFRNPVRGNKGWWISCFFAAMPKDVQQALIEAELGEDAMCQHCNPSVAWAVKDGVAAATFATISVSPSLDGGPNFWHGQITNGEIVGGI